MKVGEIIKQYLVENNFDGLFDGDSECACLKEDLFPCDAPCDRCEPGHKLPCDCAEEHIFHLHEE